MQAIKIPYFSYLMLLIIIKPTPASRFSSGQALPGGEIIRFYKLSNR